MTRKQRTRAVDAAWTPLPPRHMSRNERKRAMRRDVFLFVLALVILPICAAYLANYLTPSFYM